jgi:hypothetical protein
MEAPKSHVRGISRPIFKRLFDLSLKKNKPVVSYSDYIRQDSPHSPSEDAHNHTLRRNHALRVANYHPTPRPLENYRLLARTTSSLRTFISPTPCSVNITAVSAPVCEWTTGDVWTTNSTLTRQKKTVYFIIIIDSTVLVRTLAVSHRGFNKLIKILVRTPLDEWLARRKGLYLQRTTQHKKSIPWAWFEPTIPVNKRPRPT